ncbi:MAG: peptidase, partial [Gemmatimonadaceae bacterium]|nr:peptidase [Gloeobacterales cyanobacterium ES-bin-141]
HFYADLYPREGKYGHFAAFDLGIGHANPDGTYRNTFAAMVGNWPRGTAGKPALLSHDDVETFFHEFGHIMHQTLTRAKYASLAGTNVRRDYVEAPSQVLENWVWDPVILKRISKHYQTGEPLPDALLDKMVAAKHVNEGIYTSRQLLFATADYRYHSSGSKVDTTATWNQLSQAVMQVPAVPGTHSQASFGHLMGGYDSGYYGYLWSKVFAQDMFTRFEKEGLTSSQVGAEYRKRILEPGGVAEPDVLIRDFLGREPSKEAFYRELGL